MVLATAALAEQTPRLCACGCGRPVLKPECRYVKGHRRATSQRRRALAVSATKLRKRWRRATPLGQAIIDRALALEITLQESAARLELSYSHLRLLLRRKSSRLNRATQTSLCDFLARSPEEVSALTRRGALWVTLNCHYCGEPFERRRREAARAKRRFCTPVHYHAFQRGRTRPPRKPLRAPRGRQAAKLRRLADRRADTAFAQAAGISQTSISAIRTGAKRPRAFTVYRLERVDHPDFPRQDRPALQAGFYNYCFESRMAPHALAEIAGIPHSTLNRAMRRNGASAGTLAKLARAMGQEPADLESLCDPKRRQPRARTQQPGRPGRPRQYSSNAQRQRAYRERRHQSARIS